MICHKLLTSSDAQRRDRPIRPAVIYSARCPATPTARSVRSLHPSIRYISQNSSQAIAKLEWVAMDAGSNLSRRLRVLRLDVINE